MTAHRCDSHPGRPCPRPDYSQAFLDRFWSNVDKSGECWLWTGSRTRGGYGRYGKAGRLYAHRLMWQITQGPIPSGIEVAHRCDNPPCVKPAHLFLATHADNMADMAAKGRAARNTGLVGSAAHSAKITEPIAAEIRRSYAVGGISQTTLAGRYGLSQQTISRLVNRLAWRHVA